MGRAAILRGVTKELKVAVRVENPGTLDEVTTIYDYARHQDHEGSEGHK